MASRIGSEEGHSMHGSATGDQLWITRYGSRSTRLAAGLNSFAVRVHGIEHPPAMQSPPLFMG
jgi:hypothetical protein